MSLQELKKIVEIHTADQDNIITYSNTFNITHPNRTSFK